MMRTVEVLMVIVIMTGAFLAASYYAVLPWPREVSPMDLRRMAYTTLELLDTEYDLSMAAFDTDNSSRWGALEVALAASLPTNTLYNLTIYDVGTSENGAQLYDNLKSISNAEDLGSTSDATSYLLASSNVTFNVTPEKVGENSGGMTLYILNCSDANGWWITGYTAHSLADDFYELLSPYFSKTVVVQNTSQLGQLLSGIKITATAEEKVENALIINTFGESVPMPGDYYETGSLGSDGYDASAPSGYGYTKYCYTLGKKIREYNWTWASIVGYPFYYVSNKNVLMNQQNGWGVYGMRMTEASGLNSFLEGMDNQSYSYNSDWATDDIGVVSLTAQIMDSCNYYGIYPSPTQTSTRAMSNSILSQYNLSIGLSFFNPSTGNENYIPGAIYRHIFRSSNDTTGSLLAVGLTRTTDIRVTAVGILSYYRPRLYRSEYSIYGTSKTSCSAA